MKPSPLHHITQARTLCAAVTLAAAVLAGCTADSYESGDGDLSWLNAEFVEARTISDRTVREVSTDNGETLRLQAPFSADWMQKPDTVYRALLYYDRHDIASLCNARAMNPVPVLRPMAADEAKDMPDDPVALESVWLSANARYVNISLLLLSGSSGDDTALHTIGIVHEGTVTDDEGRTHALLSLRHDQGNVPQYYTTQHFVSIPTALINADMADISVNTYDGVVTKCVQAR